MNRMKKEQRKKRRKFLADLNNHEIEFLQEAETLRAQFNTFKRKLHQALFPEESDFMADDHVDADNRRRGINPMQESYQKEVNARRQKMGLKSLEPNGMAHYDDSLIYTKEKVARLLTSQDQNLKAEIEELIDVDFNFKRFMEHLNSYDVTQYHADRRKEMADKYGAHNV